VRCLPRAGVFAQYAHMPHLSTVLLWIVKGERGDEEYKAFSEQYPAIHRQREIEEDEAARNTAEENKKNLKAAARDSG